MASVHTVEGVEHGELQARESSGRDSMYCAQTPKKVFIYDELRANQ